MSQYIFSCVLLFFTNLLDTFSSSFKMRSFARAIQCHQFGARSSFLRRSARHQRGFASVNGQDVKGLTVIDHHYEYAPSSFIPTTRLTQTQRHRRRCRRRRPTRSRWPHRIRSQDCMHIQTLSHTLAHRRRTRRHQRRARQHDQRRLALAHVRHSQRV